MGFNTLWTPYEDEILRLNTYHASKELLAVLPGRGIKGIQGRRYELGLTGSYKGKPLVSRELLMRVTDRDTGEVLADEMTYADAAKVVGITVETLRDYRLRTDWGLNPRYLVEECQIPLVLPPREDFRD